MHANGIVLYLVLQTSFEATQLQNTEITSLLLAQLTVITANAPVSMHFHFQQTVSHIRFVVDNL